MNEELQKLEQLAALGDLEALNKLKELRRHYGLCPNHGLTDCDDCFTDTLVWDTYENTKAHAEFIREENPELTEDEAWEQASQDSDWDQMEWDGLCQVLSEWIEELNPDNRSWIVSGQAIGWRRGSGRKTVSLRGTPRIRGHGYLDPHDPRSRQPDYTIGQELLWEILPHTENTFTIYKSKKQLRIVNSHHDAMGEVYLLEPATMYYLCDDPNAWVIREWQGKQFENKILREFPTRENIEIALRELEEQIEAKWGDSVLLDWTHNCIDILYGPIGDGTEGNQKLIKEINTFVKETAPKIINKVMGEISGYHECDCCGVVIVGWAMCDACIKADCGENFDFDRNIPECRVICTHDNYRIENGIKICNECELEEGE